MGIVPLNADVPSAPRPKVILLDAVGTVIEPFPGVADAYQAIGRSAGVEIDLATIRRRFQEAIGLYSVAAFQSAQGAADPHRTDEAVEYRRWQSIVQHVLAPNLPQRNAVFEMLWYHFSEPRNWQLFADVRPALAQLHQAGYRLGLASNFDRRLKPIAEELLGEFDLELFVSSEVGWVKPAEAYYAEVTRRLALRTEEILVIGDDYENDVAAPRRFGWQAWFLNRSPATVDSESTQIADLKAAAEILCSLR